MNLNYVVILIDGEKIAIEAYFCEVKEGWLIFYNKYKSIIASFSIKNIVGFYEKQ